MLHRRQFHRIAAAAAGLAYGASSRRARGESPAAKYPPGLYFDIHTHFGRTTNYTEPLTAEDLLRWMDAHGIAQAAVLPLVSPESSTYSLTPDVVIEQTKPYRDRLIPFCSIDPRTDYAGGKRGLLGMLQRYVETGAKGFGEHKTGVPIDDPRNMDLYAACAEVKLPVLMHMDNARSNLRYPTTRPERSSVTTLGGCWESEGSRSDAHSTCPRGSSDQSVRQDS